MTVLHPAKSHAPPTWAWYALAVPNQDFQWAVPCFLMLSALVNALSLSRNPDLSRYAQRRALTALLPYVLWSGVYIVINDALSHRHHLSLGHIAKLLLAGTAEFHLYFFVLALEMYLLLPLFVPLFQRRPPLWLIIVFSIVLQGGIYLLNRFVLLHKFQPTILWDVLPVALGLWLFSQWERWEILRQRGQWAAGIVTLGTLGVYSPLAIDGLLHWHPHAFIKHLSLNMAIAQFRHNGFKAGMSVLHNALYQWHLNTALYQFGEWGYTAGMSFLMLALAYALGRNSLTRLLAFFGAESLAIYVMHPLAISALDKLKLKEPSVINFPTLHLNLHFLHLRLHWLMHLGTGQEIIIYYAACLALPLLAAWVWRQGKMAVAGKL